MDIVKGEISTLAFGGQGILRHENLVVFIPFTAPGDIVTCRLKERKKNYAKAEVLHYHHFSPQRIQPSCPYYETCGGCQLQHLNDSTQLEYKRLWVEDALKRIGRFPDLTVPPVIPAKTQWAYRRHISLTLQPAENSFQAGFIALDNQSLLPVEQCPIFVENSNPIIAQVRAFVETLPSEKSNSGKVTIFKHGDHAFLLYFQFKRMPNSTLNLFENGLEKYGNWSGISIKTGNGSFALGETVSEIEVEGLNFSLSPQAFSQNHPEQSFNIYKNILSLAKKKKNPIPSSIYTAASAFSLHYWLRKEKGF